MYVYSYIKFHGSLKKCMCIVTSNSMKNHILIYYLFEKNITESKRKQVYNLLQTVKTDEILTALVICNRVTTWHSCSKQDA